MNLANLIKSCVHTIFHLFSSATENNNIGDDDYHTAVTGFFLMALSLLLSTYLSSASSALALNTPMLASRTRQTVPTILPCQEE